MPPNTLADQTSRRTQLRFSSLCQLTSTGSIAVLSACPASLTPQLRQRLYTLLRINNFRDPDSERFVDDHDFTERDQLVVDVKMSTGSPARLSSSMTLPGPSCRSSAIFIVVLPEDRVDGNEDVHDQVDVGRFVLYEVLSPS